MNMNGYGSRLFVVAFIGMILGGCMATENLVHIPEHDHMAVVDDYDTRLHRNSVHIFNPLPIDERVSRLRLQRRVKHLVFLIDQSTALSSSFRGFDTQFYAKEVVRRFIKTMPRQRFSSTIVTYHNAVNPSIYAPLDTRLSIAPSLPSDLEKILNSNDLIQRAHLPSLSLALDLVSELVGNLNGPTAVVLVTDWSQINETVENAVLRMRQRITFSKSAHVVVPKSASIEWPQSHSGLCFYTIGVGNYMSRSRLESADSCGFSSAVDKVAQPSNMANFVETVLYKGPLDSDLDGIYDYQDACPNTPSNKIVDYSGCPRFTTGN